MTSPPFQPNTRLIPSQKQRNIFIFFQGLHLAQVIYYHLINQVDNMTSLTHYHSLEAKFNYHIHI